MDGYEEEEEESLVEERKMVVFTKSNSTQPIKRKGLFLKPISDSTSTPSGPCYDHPPIFSVVQNPPKVLFRGWANPQRPWGQWVDKLKPTYIDLWEKVGIFDAIRVSTYKFGRDPSSICGLVRFWCGETNTFLFPWGEATVTLEDVMVLGGFSVTGDPVRLASPLEGEMAEMESQMISEMRKFNRCTSKKPEISAWLRHYMERGKGDDLEHIAFLVLWLSRFVFSTHPVEVVKTNVLPIAIRLSRGERIALAPAVLASIYRDLRLMRAHLSSNADSRLLVWAPFNLVQFWVWERFSALRPVTETSVGNEGPRAARWSDVGKTMDFTFVVSVLESSDEFQWRTYATGLDHKDEELGALARCLRACELVGLDCIEQYLPHRVAMQFGLDQDIPKSIIRRDLTWEIAWKTYDISKKNVKFYVHSSLYEPDVTLRYSVWWKKNVRRFSPKKIGKKRKKVCSPPKRKKQKKMKKMEDLDDVTLSDWLGQEKLSISRKTKFNCSIVALNPNSDASKEEVQQASETPQGEDIGTLSDWLGHEKLSISRKTKFNCSIVALNPNSDASKEEVQQASETPQGEEIVTLSDWLGNEKLRISRKTKFNCSIVALNSNSDALKEEVQQASETPQGEEIVSDPSVTEDKEITVDTKKANAEESVDENESFDAPREVQLCIEASQRKEIVSDMEDIKEANATGSVDGNQCLDGQREVQIPQGEEFVSVDENHSLDAMEEVQLGSETPQGEEFVSNPSEIENEETTVDTKKANAEESVDENEAFDATREIRLCVEASQRKEFVSDPLGTENKETMGDIKEANATGSVDGNQNLYGQREAQQFVSDPLEIENKKIVGETEKSNTRGSVDENESLDAMGEVQLGSGTPEREDSVSDLVNIENKEIMGDIKKAGAGESFDDPAVIEGVPEKSKIAEGTALKCNESKLELEIRKLKEEIALIHARVMDLESQA